MTHKSFQIGGQTLFNDSWQSVLHTIPDSSVDAVISDPPYATTQLAWDDRVDWRHFWSEIDRVCKPAAIVALFASGKFVPVLMNSNLDNFRYELIWEKPQAVGYLDANRRPMRAHEQVLVFCRQWKSSIYNPQFVAGRPHQRGGNKSKPKHYDGDSKPVPKSVSNLYHPRSVLKYARDEGSNSRHPTAKPIALVEFLVRSFSNEGSIVLDPFNGSGTTTAACLLNRRKGLGIERDAEYFSNSCAWHEKLHSDLINENV